jgi:hypothetical protein
MIAQLALNTTKQRVGGDSYQWSTKIVAMDIITCLSMMKISLDMTRINKGA